MHIQGIVNKIVAGQPGVAQPLEVLRVALLEKCNGDVSVAVQRILVA